MRYGIVGSRGFGDLPMVREWILKHVTPDDVIVSGGAQGVDSYATFIAAEQGIPFVEHLADWAKHGKAAGFMRNGTIVADSDIIVAFWDGKSRGTLDTLKKAYAAGKPIVMPGHSYVTQETLS